MNRREFVNYMSISALATSLPVALAACRPESTSTADENAEGDTSDDDVTRKDGFAPIGTVADLDAAGFISDVRFQGNRVIVIKDPDDASSVLAFNAVCPHAACTVTWKESLFDCDCHGSQFNADGTVSAGPSEEPLGDFEAKIEGQQVLVKV